MLGNCVLEKACQGLSLQLPDGGETLEGPGEASVGEGAHGGLGRLATAQRGGKRFNI